MFPEFLVQKGDVIRPEADPRRDEAISAYRKGADVAGALGLHFVELQALTRLVTVLREHGGGADEVERLAAVFRSIEGGASEREVTVARELLAAAV